MSRGLRGRASSGFALIGWIGARCTGALALSLFISACGEDPTRSPRTAPSEATARNASSARAATVTAAGSGSTITLITGDRVTVRQVDGGRALTVIDPAPGRERVMFSIEEHEGEVTVVPEDMKPLLGAGQLDRALFNVSRLLADGYGDDRRAELPLLLTGVSGSAGLTRQLTEPGVSVTRTMPILGVMAVRQQKGRGTAVLEALKAVANSKSSASVAGSPSAAPPKLWLDRQLALSLDQSVPQIGGPAAQARGLTGAGVTVAVIDSGVDETHPDLAGKVVMAEAFTDDGAGTADLVGHGTHVASTIAGSGAASGGRLRGVAPGADLMNVKVCGRDGCPQSSILAGMEWAAVNGADIINMSLGGRDLPGLDPVEEAVNQLSAQYGALFVIAAGNTGPAAGTVSSPSSADAALSVGAVDKLDNLVIFSSRGPRLGDKALKPDLTAPGFGIVAARAAGTDAGVPINAFYTRLNGTSMAAPHVAGAAALLKQQHPGFTGGELKAALMGAAQPNPSLTVYEQGVGRVDVDRATRQLVSGEPASLSLGVASFPHDDDPPIIRTIRYRNRGAAPISLALSASLTDPLGDVAPAGMIRVAPASLVVPAGGEATAVLTVDTRVEAENGHFTGTLVATAEGIRVLTTVSVEREVETHELQVVMTGSDGQPISGFVSVRGLGASDAPARDVQIQDRPVTGQETLRVPAGLYLISSTDTRSEAALVAPRITVAAPTSVALDSRGARPIELTLPDAGLINHRTVIDLLDHANEEGLTLYANGSFLSGHVGPSAAPGELISTISVYMAPSEMPAPRVYHLARADRDRFSTGWRQRFRRADFARVEARHFGRPDALLSKTTAALPPEGGSVVGYILPFSEGPFERTDFYYGADILWYTDIAEWAEYADFPGEFFPTSIIDGIEQYRSGQPYHEKWNQAPFGPGFAARTLLSVSPDLSGAPRRFLGLLVLEPSLFSDQNVPARSSFPELETANLKLFRDGELVAERSSLFNQLLLFPLPAARSTYRFEAQATRSTDYFDLSTAIQAAWTFQAEGGITTELYALPTLRFQPPLDPNNRTGARLLVLPIEIERPFGAPTPAIADARAEVSFDDGATWQRLPLVRFGAKALGLVVHPRGASYVSLRGSASDVQGNTVEQTILRAYALKESR